MITRRQALGGAVAAAVAAFTAACGGQRGTETPTETPPASTPPDATAGISAPPTATARRAPNATPTSVPPTPAIPTPTVPPLSPTPRAPLRSESRVTVRPDGTTLVNGDPFFPLGFYNVCADRAENLVLDDIRLLGEAGFSVMHLSTGGDAAKNWARVYDEAAQRGVYLLPEDTNQTFVAMYRTKPSVFGWSIWDDVNPVETNYSDLAAKDRAYRQGDPNHITYYAVGGDDAVKTFTTYNTARRGDAFGLEAYPVNNAPIAGVGPYMQKAVAAAALFGQSPYGILQSFNLSQTARQRAPTFREFYNMTYQGIVAGLKGIIYYTFYDTGNYLPNDTELWAGARTLPAEIERIKPFLLDGKRTMLELTTSVTAGVWEHGDEALVIVVNALESRDATKSVSVPLPFAVDSPPRAVVAGRPTGFTIENGRLKGAISPTDVHLYLVSRQPAG